MSRNVTLRNRSETGSGWLRAKKIRVWCTVERWEGDSKWRVKRSPLSTVDQGECSVDSWGEFRPRAISVFFQPVFGLRSRFVHLESYYWSRASLEISQATLRCRSKCVTWLFLFALPSISPARPRPRQWRLLCHFSVALALPSRRCCFRRDGKALCENGLWIARLLPSAEVT